MTLLNSFLLSLLTLKAPASQADKAQAAILNAAVGDALGRVTEFVNSTQKIYQKFGFHGVTRLDQAAIIHPTLFQKITPYTDDTVMSRIVLEAAIEGRKQDHTPEQILDGLAHRFAELFGEEKYTIDPLYNLRAHGLRNIKAGSELNKLIEQGEDQDPFWWFYKRPQKDIITEAGCGSVMRAWPIGLVFADNIPLVVELANGQSAITHRHPLARAASVAMAVGTAYAYNNKSVDETVAAMIEAAELFDEEELSYKLHAQKFPKEMPLHAAMIARDELLTSDMIRYAYDAARASKSPHNVLGTNNIKQDNARSPYGFLLGWAADEAVAAAVYLFVRNANDPQRAMREGVNTPGDSDSIASLVGALLGAKTGVLYDKIDTLSALENKDTLVALAASIS